ncbi:MAG TPA: response regulator [Acidiferrobacteraceae bacterium]|nr:response regulator [Acidiferrobacteraceae bacterium]
MDAATQHEIPRQRTLLLVDDEENILKALGRLLRRDGYRILTASSGREGLALLEHHKVGVIVSDQRMPQMTGSEFLFQVKERYPDTVRIVLSGYTELKSVTDAINRGAIYKFLTKPWDDQLLRDNIKEAFRQGELQSENQRLTRELQDANAELSGINQDLERRVEEKTREIMHSLRTLHLSQDVLEYLPIAVLGIGDDDCVAVANRMATKLLVGENGFLVGQSAQQILPAELYDLHQRAMRSEDDNASYCRVEIAAGTVEACCCWLGQASYARGTVITMSLVGLRNDGD